MLFTTISALIASAALTASASPLEARQATPYVRATFYNDGGCGPSPWAEDTVFVQNTTRGVAGCHDLDISAAPFQSTYFNESSITLPLRFYDVPCKQVTVIDSPGAHWIDIFPSNGATPGCRAFPIRSWITL